MRSPGFAVNDAPSSLWITLLVLLACACASTLCAATQATNGSGTMTILGEGSFTLSAPQVSLPGPFSVRVVDPSGNPEPGLTVAFFTNYEACIPLDPNCSVPENLVYGYFADGFGEVDALTDANGVATTSYSYVGGFEPGSYTVAAMVSQSASEANAAFIKDGFDLSILYTIDQVFDISPKLDGYMSGNWFNATQSGQGFQMEFTDEANTAVVIWFTFAPDGSGQQNWIYAQGTYATDSHSVNLPAVVSTGARFPPNFHSQDITQTYWGSLTVSLTDCNHGIIAWESALAGYGSGSMPITRLTSIAGSACLP